MTQLLVKATIMPAADTDQADSQPVEKLLLGSVAVFMLVWLSLLGWLVWWLIA